MPRGHTDSFLSLSHIQSMSSSCELRSQRYLRCIFFPSPLLPSRFRPSLSLPCNGLFIGNLVSFPSPHLLPTVHQREFQNHQTNQTMLLSCLKLLDSFLSYSQTSYHVSETLHDYSFAYLFSKCLLRACSVWVSVLEQMVPVCVEIKWTEITLTSTSFSHHVDSTSYFTVRLVQEDCLEGLIRICPSLPPPRYVSDPAPVSGSFSRNGSYFAMIWHLGRSWKTKLIKKHTFYWILKELIKSSLWGLIKQDFLI